MLEIYDLERYRALDLEERERLIGGVNYALVRSFYASGSKKTVSHTNDSITKLWSYMYRLIAI